jgi:hypothetical protein
MMIFIIRIEKLIQLSFENSRCKIRPIKRKILSRQPRHFAKLRMYSVIEHLSHLRYVPKRFVVNENMGEGNTIQFGGNSQNQSDTEQIMNCERDEANNVLYMTKIARMLKDNAIILTEGMERFSVLGLNKVKMYSGHF